ncbi:MAG: hypothetical protein A2Z71_10480 [Chloroflexi bacterium RBG_13_50_21]|nr:MAG: hypothetical protein A2Z71_10480 [Chloroflexi bacterium RBG_13_50_21]OGO63399.1 MAG: hypothetical protein A2030_02870 [Chloroflexi bacterium RBG_19FT_COMBO_50_10]
MWEVKSILKVTTTQKRKLKGLAKMILPSQENSQRKDWSNNNREGNAPPQRKIGVMDHGDKNRAVHDPPLQNIDNKTFTNLGSQREETVCPY